MNIDEIKARERAATPGPWQVLYQETAHLPDSPSCIERCRDKGETPIRIDEYGHHVMRDECVADVAVANVPSDDEAAHVLCLGHDYDDYGFISVADAEFIAHARADIPALIAEVERLSGGVVGGAIPRRSDTEPVVLLPGSRDGIYRGGQ